MDNRLIGIHDSIGARTIAYQLDAEGRRIGRTLTQGGTTTEEQWLVDPARPYSEVAQKRSRTNGGA